MQGDTISSRSIRCMENEKVVYTEAEIDVLAAHIVPLDVWYVVPVQAIAAGTSLRLYPDGGCERARFEKYREAWDFFRGDGWWMRLSWLMMRKWKSRRWSGACGARFGSRECLG